MTLRHKLKVPTMILAIAGVSLAISAMPGVSAAAAGMMRDGFTWTGVAAAGGNPAFNDHCNWHSGPLCLAPHIYPDDTGDTATFPWKTTGTAKIEVD